MRSVARLSHIERGGGVALLLVFGRRGLLGSWLDATFGFSLPFTTAGVVVEALGPPSSFVAGGLAGVVVAGVLWLRRGTLAPRAAGAAVPVG